MNCKHDPLYCINNEAAGGAGCPMCAAERKAKRVVMAGDSNGTRYDSGFYAGIIAARMNDPRQHDDGQVSLPDMMLLTCRIDHAQWIAMVWPTLPEIAY